jgi:hypothetical protein
MRYARRLADARSRPFLEALLGHLATAKQRKPFADFAEAQRQVDSRCFTLPIEEEELDDDEPPLVDEEFTFITYAPGSEKYAAELWQAAPDDKWFEAFDALTKKLGKDRVEAALVRWISAANALEARHPESIRRQPLAAARGDLRRRPARHAALRRCLTPARAVVVCQQDRAGPDVRRSPRVDRDTGCAGRAPDALGARQAAGASAPVWSAGSASPACHGHYCRRRRGTLRAVL